MKSKPQPDPAGQHSLASCGRVTPALLALLAAGLTLITTSCKKQVPAAPPPPVVLVAEIAAVNAPASAEFIGQLDSPQSVEVRARVEGFVAKIIFTDGTEVKAGDPLFKLDDQPYQEKLAAANGVLAEAKAALNKYQKDVARLMPLAEKHAVPQQDLDNAVASVDVGKASVVSAEAQVQSATLDVSYCDMSAPISGLIGASEVPIGALVGKSEPTLLATISELDPIWFYCNVSEVDYLRATAETQRSGRRIQDIPVSLIVADGSTHPEKGKIIFIDRAVDTKTGTLRVRAEFANPTRSLRPGMFARVIADLGVRADSILVPQRAVAELQGKNFVWVIGPDNKAAQRPVTVGRQIEDNLLILEGLKPGDRIVVEGLQKVREGALVRPMTAEEMKLAQAAAQVEADREAETKPAKQ
ncbi:MAG: efflux RND transporter periplasmic adaptor subunit [Limisphaerales bacterium]